MQNWLSQHHCHRLEIYSQVSAFDPARRERGVLPIFCVSTDAERGLATAAGPCGLVVASVEDIQAACLANPSFLYLSGDACRQTSVLQALAAAPCPSFLEKGIFLSPNDINRLCQKMGVSRYAVVECGSAYGYADVILDPRSLLLLKTQAPCFGVSLSALLQGGPGKAIYPYRASWPSDKQFLEAFTLCAKAFGSSFFAYQASQDLLEVLDNLL